MRPVETEGYYQSTSDIATALTTDLAEMVLPTPRLLTYPKNDLLSAIDWCWKGIFYGPFCSKPYDNLNDQDSGLLTKMGFIDFFADNPDTCFFTNARTLFSGLINADVPWDWSGLARTGKDQQLSKIPRYGSWSGQFDRRAPLGMTLVHEMGHNYGRKHVGCGDPADPDTNYPYDPCMLDDGALDAPGTHFGFDGASLAPIVPDQNKDFMAYSGPKWISDYTWNAILAATRSPVFVPPFPQTQSIGDTGIVVLAGGVLTPTAKQGEMEQLWTYPAAEASDGLLAKWGAAAAVPWNAQTGGDGYHLQLRSAGSAVLGDWAIDVVPLDAHGAHESLPSI